MPPGNRESEVPDAEEPTSAEAAEAAAAEAEARAEAARARAIELRRKLEASREDTTADSDTGTGSEDAAEPDVAEPGPPADLASPDKKRRLRLPRLKTVAAALAVLVIAGLLSGTGYMIWQHRIADDQRHRSAEFAAAARQGVVNLMSMDYNNAKESVQRVIDDSTGKFKTNFEAGADDLIKAMQQAKVATKVTVNDTAVESMDKDTGTVLVAATSQRTGPDAPKEDQQPRVWRVVISLQRDGDQLKVSDVEFA
jgi:Mce-associated membrane protein